MNRARSVLLRMAEDEDRAARIRDLKESRPDLTWGRIASAIPVSERSTYDWRKTGAISYGHAVRLASVFDVDADWLWSGRDPDAPSPDLMETLRSVAAAPSQLDRIEAMLTELLRRTEPKPGTVVRTGADRKPATQPRKPAANPPDRQRRAQ